MEKHSRIYAEIDLDAIERNFENMRANISPSSKMIAVIKADGYGHGAVPIAHLMEEKEYLWGFAVATAEEAYELRSHQIHKPILILGYTFADDYEAFARQQIRPTVFQYDMAKAMSDAAVKSGEIIKIHLAVDTGMTRIGFRDDASSLQIIRQIQKLPGLSIEGLFTHFAKADERDKAYTYHQLERYLQFENMLEEAGIHIPVRHCSNSAGILEIPDANLDVVRAGITMYGIYPSPEVSRNTVPLLPAMSLKSRIVYIKEVEAGIPISYGGIYVTEKKTRVATIPVGYGDGYPRSLSNKGYVLIHGKRAPILGRVCMDQFMVDVTQIPEAKELDEVILMGNSQGTSLSVEELAELSDRFPYEFVCCVGKRVPRVYKREGRSD